MFTGFSEKTIDFMRNIRLNNSKAWFDEHKDEFKQKRGKQRGFDVLEGDEIEWAVWVILSGLFAAGSGKRWRGA